MMRHRWITFARRDRRAAFPGEFGQRRVWRWPMWLLAASLLAVPHPARTQTATVPTARTGNTAHTAYTPADHAAAAAAFEAMVPVLRHPRCINCHDTGDYPRQGDDNHPHIMDIRRGPDGQGVNGVRCSTCHQDHNLPGLHTPPGAPEWGLPPAAMPMIWYGLTDRQLCELLKDPNQNGHRTVAQIVEHMKTPIVLWGWHPGEGRTPIPMPAPQFEHLVALWASHGAGCPAGDRTTPARLTAAP